MVSLLEADRPFWKPRQEEISSTPAIYEREMARLADALAEALESRGVTTLRAVQAARTGMMAFAQATTAWLDDPEPDLGARLDTVRLELGSLISPA